MSRISAVRHVGYDGLESTSFTGMVFSVIHEKAMFIEGHSMRVSQLCEKVGMAMKLTEAELYELKVSGMLHDIGKIAIDGSILSKPGRLTKKEWDEVKQHSEVGCRILSAIPGMEKIAQYVLYHHERYDGTGYPKGLKQEEIPLISRIIAVADSYDAMTDERPYRKAISKDMAIKELVRCKGTQYDPHVVDVFIKII